MASIKSYKRDENKMKSCNVYSFNQPQVGSNEEQNLKLNFIFSTILKAAFVAMKKERNAGLEVLFGECRWHKRQICRYLTFSATLPTRANLGQIHINIQKYIKQTILTTVKLGYNGYSLKPLLKGTTTRGVEFY